MRTTSRLVLVTCLALGALPAAESALRFVDLRAQGGLTVSEGETANLTLMAGDIGNKDQHVISLDADMGIVIGLRGQVAEITAERDDGLKDFDVKLGGGTVLGGLGFYLGKNSHAELVGGYAKGVGSTTGSNPWEDRDTSYTQYLGELGWYYTWSSHIQVGLTAGYSVMKLKYDDPVLNKKIKAEAKGFDGGVAIGFRF
jgi:hypothetical protein